MLEIVLAYATLTAVGGLALIGPILLADGYNPFADAGNDLED